MPAAPAEQAVCWTLKANAWKQCCAKAPKHMAWLRHRCGPVFRVARLIAASSACAITKATLEDRLRAWAQLEPATARCGKARLSSQSKKRELSEQLEAQELASH